MGFLSDQDKIKRDLEERFPGWHIWYVPSTHERTAWCAQPWPLINTRSPEHLAAEIIQAHTEASADWPALASVDDYAIHAPGARKPKSR